MQDVRCKNCNKLLAKANTFDGAIRCKGCKMIFEYHIYSNVYSNLDDPKQKENLQHNSKRETI